MQKRKWQKYIIIYTFVQVLKTKRKKKETTSKHDKYMILNIIMEKTRGTYGKRCILDDKLVFTAILVSCYPFTSQNAIFYICIVGIWEKKKVDFRSH